MLHWSDPCKDYWNLMKTRTPTSNREKKPTTISFSDVVAGGGPGGSSYLGLFSSESIVVGTSDPQCRHFIASFLMSSAQNGHFLDEPLFIEFCSTISWFVDTTKAKMIANGPIINPNRNQPSTFRPLFEATTAHMNADNKNNANNSIYFPFSYYSPIIIITIAITDNIYGIIYSTYFNIF